MTDATLRGRRVLVTGATRGIGLSVAEGVARLGGEVHLLARSAADLEAVARATGGRAWPADLRDEADVWDVVDRLQDALGGPPDALVNAAGAFEIAPAAETTVAVFDRALSVNLRGAFLLTRALLPGMLARGRGDLVHLGSVAGRRALPGNAAYGASKYGLRGLHEVLVEETRGTGVRVTLVEPSATDTPAWDPLRPDERPDLPGRAQMLAPGDVAEVVLFVLTRPMGVRVPLVQVERA